MYTPTLTGLGERAHLLSPAVDLDLHITRHRRRCSHYEDLRDVILVGHSYGGMVITGVADRATDRVGHLVFLDAANPQNGQSLSTWPDRCLAGRAPNGQVVDGVELVLFPGTDPMQFLRRHRPASRSRG